MKSIRLARWAGWMLVIFGVLYLWLTSPMFWLPAEVSYPGEPMMGTKQDDDYLGWGALLLGFLTLGSTHYFKLKEARRADRREAREVHDRRNRGDDIH